ncbi:pentapeptide repeat-containing protein [Microbacterium sp. CFH 31415]|uniref:pentapeptide repeat-containing protein n=1 Tax=Microbacterium sp. CFH 31415 TaxID=2921732 RepID=UPI001F13E77F|nr:pentapeptide repeat-containing protein [Microbacterium sp. CFH 31415]MCH6229424.1 pentapeptide repeat-containing protein [Microbacterium sp. CFH 31415]
MARPLAYPLAPRVSAPDLPREFFDVIGLERRGDHLQASIGGLSGEVDASHAALTECIVAAASVDRLDLTGATLVDVEFNGLRATSVRGADARLRRVLLTGGRIGTLDLGAAGIDEVELRGIRIDYLSLGGAKVEDLRVADCAIETLDLPQATLTRVRFENTRAGEVDTRGMRADSVDFRGLDAAAYLDVSSLRRVTLTPWQVEQLAPAFAAALATDVQD